ncbi:MAG: hypothetical protein LIO46_04160 [Clostridiales bacterium]|nr:hypothetical protein [Clostridiales bacterium]
MKRIAAVLLAAVFVLSAAACSREGRLEISASEIMFVDSYQKNVYDETQISYYEEPTQQILARVLFSALPGKGEEELYYVLTYYSQTSSNLNAGQRVQKGTAKVDAGYLETGLKLKLEAAEEETLEAGSYQLSIRTHEGGDLIIQSKITVRDPDAPEEGETIPAEYFTQ